MTWEMRRHRDPLWWLFEAWGWLEESLRRLLRKPA